MIDCQMSQYYIILLKNIKIDNNKILITTN